MSEPDAPKVRALKVEIALLELKEGDTLVVKVPGFLHQDVFKLMDHYLRTNVPKSVNVLILDGGRDLQVLRGPA